MFYTYQFLRKIKLTCERSESEEENPNIFVKKPTRDVIYDMWCARGGGGGVVWGRWGYLQATYEKESEKPGGRKDKVWGFAVGAVNPRVQYYSGPQPGNMWILPRSFIHLTIASESLDNHREDLAN
jgi:hypothetical protein